MKIYKTHKKSVSYAAVPEWPNGIGSGPISLVLSQVRILSAAPLFLSPPVGLAKKTWTKRKCVAEIFFLDKYLRPDDWNAANGIKI